MNGVRSEYLAAPCAKATFRMRGSFSIATSKLSQADDTTSPFGRIA